MKNLIYLLFSVTLLFVFSCKGDPCEDIACGINSVCDEGNCSCAEGWSVDNNGNCSIQDFCFNTDCGNGTCEQDNSGSWCECDAGYEFDADNKCTQELRSKYIGTWVGTHIVNGTTSGSYTVTIGADTDVTKAKMTNVMNVTCSVSASPVEAIITFRQSFQDFVSTCNGVDISGSGNSTMNLISENTLRMYVGVTIGQNSDGYTGIYTRQ